MVSFFPTWHSWILGNSLWQNNIELFWASKSQFPQNLRKSRVPNTEPAHCREYGQPRDPSPENFLIPTLFLTQQRIGLYSYSHYCGWCWQRLSAPWASWEAGRSGHWRGFQQKQRSEWCPHNLGDWVGTLFFLLCFDIFSESWINDLYLLSHLKHIC